MSLRILKRAALFLNLACLLQWPVGPTFNKSTRSPTASRCVASKEQVHAPLGNPSDSPTREKLRFSECSRGQLR